MIGPSVVVPPFNVSQAHCTGSILAAFNTPPPYPITTITIFERSTPELRNSLKRPGD
jgi:hypothetical protein